MQLAHTNPAELAAILAAKAAEQAAGDLDYISSLADKIKHQALLGEMLGVIYAVDVWENTPARTTDQADRLEGAVSVAMRKFREKVHSL